MVSEQLDRAVRTPTSDVELVLPLMDSFVYSWYRKYQMENSKLSQHLVYPG